MELSFSKRTDVLSQRDIDLLKIKVQTELFTPLTLANKLYQTKDRLQPFFSENNNLKNVLLEDMAKGRVLYDNCIVEIDKVRFIYVSEERQKLPNFGFNKVIQKTGRKEKLK